MENHGVYDLNSLLSNAERDFLVKNNGEQVNISALQGKTVGLYFSGYWCGPCRRFTPDLIEVYNQLLSKGDFEIIFISSDKDDESFNNYFSKMPWLAVPFSDSEVRKKVKATFEIRGIPSLVILDHSGKVITTNGRLIIDEYGMRGYPFTHERMKALEEEEEAARRNQTLQSILVSGSQDFVVKSDGTKVSVSELVGKTVLFYFSAHWCPPCRSFTPKLIEAYNAIKVTHEAFEIVFISSDQDQKAFDDYYSSMPWLALPFGDKRERFLSRTFKVKGIPTLVAIGPSGRTLTTEARSLIENSGPDAYPFGEDKPRDDSTKEKDENIEEAKGNDSKEEWVCDGDVCRKA